MKLIVLSLASATLFWACEAKEVAMPLQERPAPAEEPIAKKAAGAEDPLKAVTPDEILLVLEEARALADRGEELRARLKYKKALRLNPGNITALQGLAESHTREGDLKKAEDYYKKLLRSDGRHIKTLYTLAHMLRDQKRTTDALVYSKKLVGVIGTDPNALALHGTLLLEADKSLEAIVFLERSLSQEKNQPDVMNNLANAHARQGHPDRAEPLYRSLILLDPSNANTHYNLGTVLQDQKKYKEALGAYKSCLALEPEHPQANEAYKELMKWARQKRAAQRQ